MCKHHGDLMAKETKTEHVGIMVTPEMGAEIEAEAERQGRSKSDLVRRAVAEALRGWKAHRRRIDGYTVGRE